MDECVLKIFQKQSLTHNRYFLLEVWHEECHCLLHDVLVDVLMTHNNLGALL